MSLGSYWFTNFSFDILKTLLLSTMTIVCLNLFNMELPDFWVILLLYPFAIIPFTYATSFLFSKESSAQNSTLLIHVLISCIGAVGVFMLRLIKQTEDNGDLLAKVFKVIPSFAFTTSMLYSTSKDIFNETRNYTEGERL